jgi:hypothetical protein
VKHPKYASPLHSSPHRVAGSAANLVYEVAPLILQSRLQRAKTVARRAATRTSAAAKALPAKTASWVSAARAPEFRERLREDARLLQDIVGGKVKERFSPLISKLTERAAQ